MIDKNEPVAKTCSTTSNLFTWCMNENNVLAESIFTFGHNSRTQ